MFGFDIVSLSFCCLAAPATWREGPCQAHSGTSLWIRGWRCVPPHIRSPLFSHYTSAVTLTAFVTSTPPATLFDKRGLRRASTQVRRAVMEVFFVASHTTWERG